MSHSDIIKEQLNILDLNVIFSESYFEKRKIKGEICFIYKGKISYIPQECLHCKDENNHSIIKWGFKKTRLLINDVSEYKTYLALDKQRF